MLPPLHCAASYTLFERQSAFVLICPSRISTAQVIGPVTGCFPRTVGWLELNPTRPRNKGQQSLRELAAKEERQLIYVAGNIIRPGVTECLLCQALRTSTYLYSRSHSAPQPLCLNREPVLTGRSQMDHVAVSHVDGPVPVAKAKNLNQVSKFWCGL